MSTDTAPIRAGEELDVVALSRFLSGKIPGAEAGIELEQFPGGHSNLTYLLTAGGTEYVLRRAPLGPVAPKAHDMGREFRVLAAVHPHFPPAPRVHLLCEDPAVIGAVFYLMERRRGIVLRSAAPPEYERHAEWGARVSTAFVDCLAALHTVDIHRQGLIGLGKPEGYLERQVGGWSERWRRSRTEELSAMDEVIGYLNSRMPAAGPPTLIHNDYKLDNIMLDPADPGRISAVLDWEMATVGDPLSDVGLALCYWLQAGQQPVGAMPSAGGWFSREQIIGRYEKLTGRDLSGIVWYEVLGIFKLAVIVQQIYSRYFHGQTRDERFKDFHLRVRALIDAALQRLNEAG
jgi:aminoglycoside phosphotransferase (APT) family kinase protein